MNWKYVKTLTSYNLIDEFERIYNCTLPEEYKNCVQLNNGGRPEKRVFDTEKSKEREIKSLLSFNKEDKETIWKINEWNKEDLLGKYVAFAIDNYGNLICFNLNNQIVFIDHETGNVEYICEGFAQFIDSLYE